MNTRRLRVGLLATHPIQYYAPWYRALATLVELDVYFCHRQTPNAQAAAGFGVEFEWDVPLLDGYRSRFLRNVAAHPDASTFLGCNTPDIATVIEKGRFDAFVVHGWSNISYWQAMRACWRTRTPIFVRGDSTLDEPRSVITRIMKWPVYRWFIPKFDGYLVVGQHARDYVLHYGAKAERCFDAPHSVDNTFFSSGSTALRQDATGLRRRFDLEPGRVVFLFVGKLIEGKEADTFVTAVAQAAREYPGISGLIAGDGPLRADVEARILQLGAPIHIAGFLNQRAMVAAYAASDVLVVASRRETWGLVVNEAMACGLPAIVSDGVGCARNLVTPGVTGDIFRAGVAAELSDAIVRFARDAPFRQTVGTHARTRIAAYDVGVAAAGTVAAISTVVAERADHTHAHAIGSSEAPL